MTEVRVPDRSQLLTRSVAACFAALVLATSACTASPPAPTTGPDTSPLPSPTGTPTASAGPTATPTPEPSPPTLPEGTTMGVVLGNPWSKDPHRQDAVIESAMDIINHTPRGETLVVSIFNMTYPGFDDTLIRAHRRGVDVRVLVNHEKAGRKRYDALKRELGRNTGRDSFFVVRGGGIRMHSKFLLASRSDGREHVVWMSSGNMTIASGRHQANEALTITGDKRLYQFFTRQFELMARGTRSPGKLARTVTTPTAVVQTYPLPEGGKSHDPVWALLQDITCVVGGKPTLLRMAQLFFTDERLYIADRLRELKADGCDVRLVGHISQWDKAKDELTRPGDGQIDVRSAQGAALHTKITTIDGWDAAGKPLKLAMVGSHNLSGRALTRIPEGVNDEFSITVNDPASVDAYSKFVDRVIDRHSKSITG